MNPYEHQTSLFTEIGKALVNYGVENLLGITLLHNHFLLERHETLVNFDSVALPVDTRNGTKQLGPVHASTWRFMDNGIAPYEFTHEAQESLLNSQPVQSFFADFGAILAKWDLANIFGICSLKEEPIDRPTTMEFTSGRANITFKFDLTPDDGNTTDAMWRFSSNPMSSSFHSGKLYGNPEDIYGPKAFGQCKIRCKGKPHLLRQFLRHRRLLHTATNAAAGGGRLSLLEEGGSCARDRLFMELERIRSGLCRLARYFSSVSYEMIVD